MKNKENTFTCMKWLQTFLHISMCVVPEDDDSLSGGAIAGIVIGGIVVLVVLAVLVVILVVLLWMRHDSRSGKYKPSFDTEGVYFIGI